MKRMPLLAIGLLALASTAAAQDLATTAGSKAKVVLENDQVRVIELNIEPGDSTGMHSHGKNIVVFISGGAAIQTMADGSKKAMVRKPGEVLWSDPVTHDTKNTSKTPVRSLVIELKQP
jgi:quercetin dioxygenase-like cupin family protein